MRVKDFFGDWCRVVDTESAELAVKSLVPEASLLCPRLKDVYKAFQLCDYNDLRVVIIGKEPYNQHVFGVPKATGVAFANSKETPKREFSPYLANLMESIIDFSIPHDRIIFDPSLEKWEKQGVLLLNMALTSKVDKEGCCINLWKPFISTVLKNLSEHKTGIVYVLLGSEVYLSLRECINPSSNIVLPVFNPSSSIPPSLWRTINNLLIKQNGYGIEWYEEYSEQENQECNSQGV